MLSARSLANRPSVKQFLPNLGSNLKQEIWRQNTPVPDEFSYSFGNAFHVCPSTIGSPSVLPAQVWGFSALL